jgi:hypothetical protein
VTDFRVDAYWVVGDRETAFRLAEALMVMGAETSSAAPVQEDVSEDVDMYLTETYDHGWYCDCDEPEEMKKL